MSKYIRDPDHKDFLEWAKKDPEIWEEFYRDYILEILLDLEQEDYFGTEGFDKRFA